MNQILLDLLVYFMSVSILILFTIIFFTKKNDMNISENTLKKYRSSHSTGEKKYNGGRK